MVKVREYYATAEQFDPEAWVAHVAADLPEPDRQLISTACELAHHWGSSLASESAASCFDVGLTTAELVADLDMDAPAIAAAVLYTTLSQQPVEQERLAELAGQEVASITAWVQQLDAVRELYGYESHTPSAFSQVDNLRRMLLAIVEDVRVVVIKLAERLSILIHSKKSPPEQQQQLAKAVQDIYAPLANRLGIGQLKWELEDLAFRYLHAETYKEIATWLDERRMDRELYIEQVQETLKQALATFNVKAEVYGRAKHIYSIWRKMQRKGIPFGEVYDVRAVRVMVPEVADCYTALGCVHALWQHVPREFDDYIATPKENGYQSLHTAVIGPSGKTLEVQIRTQGMHQDAELGVAAHWRYKEGNQNHERAMDAKIAWLRQVLDWQDDLADSDNLLRDLRTEVFDDKVYLFTPSGDVLSLPHGATPLDFAYHIHTEVGHSCRGAKVNGRIVPLTYVLQTGEQVEILTTKQPHPSRDWLNTDLGYLCTPRARAKVQHWFRLQDRERNLQDGQQLFEQEMRQLGFAQVSRQSLAEAFNFLHINELYIAIGRGEISLTQVSREVQILLGQHRSQPETLPVVKARPQKSADVMVQGVGNLLTHMAKCCKPVPGDAIIGYITQGRGVSIHRQDCRNVMLEQEADGQRLIEVSWGEEPNKVYPVDVAIQAYDRQGLLRDITNVLANEKVNVIAVQTISHKSEHTADMLLTLEVDSLDKLGRVLSRINQLPNVESVARKV